MNGLKSAAIWLLIFLPFIILSMRFSESAEKASQISITRVMELARDKKIDGTVKDRQGTLEGFYLDGGQRKPFSSTYLDSQAEEILRRFTEAGIQYEARPASTLLYNVFITLLLPVLLILAMWFLFMRQLQGSGNKAMSFGKSRAKLLTEGQTRVTFDDVAGVDEAKEELQEIVEFLKDPDKFSRLGGHIPKGVLLYGPPGTGKTLLAKAVAGEANVPFFSISGSDFVEMFVGVGASRVRDLFEQGKKHKPCLIFIDEIDAVGRHRGFGIGGGHDEREQTLNQLLVEMDGFNMNEGIILVAATNRPDVLDPALLRPGRFDRQITVDFPDVKGRAHILNVHLKKVKTAGDINVDSVAKATSGFSGADLANVVNEAALLAARRNRDGITMAELDEARDRVMMGPERRSLAQSDKEKRKTAYHEAGHAISARLVGLDDEVHKVTIVPRGRALGLTSLHPSEQRFSMSRNQMRDSLVMMLGGRAAEDIVFGDFTTGAANDLERVTKLAHAMVCEYGMSDKLGPRTYGENRNGSLFVGRGDMGQTDRNYSDETARLIDAEIRQIVDTANQRAYQILNDNRDILDRVAQALLDRETITGEDLTLLIEGKPLPDLPKNEPAAQEESDEPPTPDSEPPKKKSGLFGKPLLDQPA
jgi:cell division protease FtsH